MARQSTISDDAVRKATGRDWQGWVELLSAAGAADWTHREIVAWLAANTELSRWWQQSVAVGFEKATGKRVAGETAGAGFQVGVRMTVAAPLEAAWAAFASPAGRDIWLGCDVPLEPKARYRSADGMVGEIRVVRPCDRIRFTRCPPDEAPCSTVQIALQRSGEAKAAFTFHHEKLASAEQREAMRRHWKTVAERVKALVEGGGAGGR